MEYSSFWEADSNSAGQEIPRPLRNPKVHYLIHKSQIPMPWVTIRKKLVSSVRSC
jgi:hypothetical protein